MAQVQLHTLDWFWLIAYLLVMLISGIVFYRLGRRGESDYFLAGRGLPWWLPAASVFATHTATDSPMWVSGVVYKDGLVGLWWMFYVAWCAVSAFVSTRIFRRSLAYSQAEWQVQRFGGLGAELLRGWTAGWQIYLQMMIMGWVGMAMGKVCGYAFGWDAWIGLTVFSAIAAVYALISGYWGVIVADFQQGLIAFFAIVIVSVWGVYAAGGPDGIVERLSAMGELERANLFAFSGLFEGTYSWFFFGTILVMAFIGGIGMGINIDWYTEAQRIQSANTVRDASYSIWVGSVVMILIQSLWAVSVLAFFALNPDLTVGRHPASLGLDPELAWYRIGFEQLPVGMVGFFFAAIVAIHISTISSSLNLGSLYWTRDLYHRYVNPQATQQQLVRIGRIATFVLLLGSFVYGSMMKSVAAWLGFAIWIMAAGVWLPNVLQVVWWRFNAWGYLSSWVTNLGFSWLVVWVLPHFGVLPDLSQPQQFWVLMAVGTVIYFPVTFLTKPEDMDHLVRFYVQSRPIGFWGPVRREAASRGLILEREWGAV
ncbi:MAG: sodium:solute symporter, partial [Planctomycetaceae bacterium]